MIENFFLYKLKSDFELYNKHIFNTKKLLTLEEINQKYDGID